MSGIEIISVDRLELAFEPKSWAFADERRAEIDAHFAARQRDNPALWNGRILVMHRQSIAGGVFSGAYLETDYASFAAWCDWGRPLAGAHDCFGSAAILSADGAFLLGVMGERTLNAGQIYFPCGTPDPNDIVGGTVDLELNVRRELKEEIGFDTAEFAGETGWTSVVDGPLVAQIKVLRSREPAEVLQARARAHLASEKQPELADIRIVRSPADFEPRMRPFARAFLAHRFGLG